MFGANGIELCRIIEEELHHMQKEEDTGVPVPKFEIGEMLPEEAEKLEEDLKLEKEHMEATDRLRVLTLAARKKRVCERMSTSLKFLNFILFWPHCHQAHYDLYEKWDMISVSVAAKDTFQMDEHKIKEAFYMSDVDLNEACVHALTSGEVLVVLFKVFDTDDRDFVKVMRYALYEEIPAPKEDVPPEKQVPPIPAFERYATISKTAREVRRERYNVKMQKLREEQEERERLKREQDRLAREAEEDRIREEKKKQDEQRMARLAAGLPADPEPEEVAVAEGEGGEGEQGAEGEPGVEGEMTEAPTEAPTEVPTETPTEVPEDAQPEELQDEEKVEEEEEFHSDISVEGEDYIPPGGLFVPGLYCPPNELAKANGLALFFPKVVQSLIPIESEFLPPHVLVMFTVDKRQEIREIINQFPEDIINYGVFVGDEPSSAEHVAYTIKQYDKMTRLYRYKDRLALMVSRKRSLPLLQLAGLNPLYISGDAAAGERDCLTLFPVGYGDDYVEEESVQEEEIPEVVIVQETEPEPVVADEVKEEEDEEDEEEG